MTIVTTLTLGHTPFSQVDYPSLRCLRQQVHYPLKRRFLLPRRAVYDLRANRMRLPELDEMTVEVHPLPISLLVTNGGGAGGDVNLDLLEISMVGCNRLECHGDPHDV